MNRSPVLIATQRGAPSGDRSGVAKRCGLTTQSLRDDELQAIADATYRTDFALRVECVRQAALVFERAGYIITRTAQVSALTTAPAPLTIGGLTIDPSRRLVRYDARSIDMKHREFDMLYVLARHPDQVFSRAHLLDLAWPRDYSGDDRTIDVHISRLRRRLVVAGCRNPLLVTVPGVGYKLTTLSIPGAA